MMTKIGFKQRLMIGTWNVRTLSETSRVEQVRKEMTAYKLDILGLCEVRWLNSGSHNLTAGYSFIFSGNETHRINGVGILLSPMARRALIEYKPISDRIMTARFNCKFRKISIIQCYAPTETTDEKQKDEFYGKLEYVCNSLPEGDIKIFLGDFNAKVGCDNSNLQQVMGRNGLGDTRNNNGDRLVDFCARNRLFIGGTKFPHRNIHKYTWNSPDGQSRNQIDHVLVSKLFLGSLMNVKARRGADVDSDHNLLVATFRMRPAAVSAAHRKVEKYNIERLKDPAACSQYNANLRASLSANNTNSWATITTACKNSAKTTIGLKERKMKPWISHQTWMEIQSRKKIHNDLLRTRSSVEKIQMKEEYKSSSRRVKYLARFDREKYYNDIAEQAEHAANTGNIRGVYSAIKQLSGKNVRGTAVLKAHDGSDLTTSEQQLERWREFFTTQANGNTEEAGSYNINPTTRRNPRREISTEPPTCAEVIAALSRMKNYKSAGPDNINAELLKYGSTTLAEYITPLIRDAWINNRIPSEWKDGTIVTIPKKGNLALCKNWRGITLLNSIGKVMATLILQRIQPVVEQLLRKEQAGFRNGRSCVDHVNTLRIMIEQSMEYKSHLYLLFVDFERAFDTVNRDSLWAILTRKGIPDKIVNLIKELYEDARYTVLYNGKTSSSFTITRGVRQGCILSPTLFLLLLDSVMEETNREAPQGIRWNMNEYLNDIDYADDICLMAHRFDDIQNKLKKLVENASKVGLKVNFNKTKIMRIGTENVTPLSIEGTTIEDVESITYLGCKLSKDGGSLEDIKTRINKARVAFFKLHNIWRANNISVKTKLRIFNSSVKSVLLYGCTTWSLTANSQNSLQTFVNRCLRQIIRVYWPNWITNEMLWQRTNSKPIPVEIRKRRWTWIGHILRRPTGEIARTALDWNPQGQRRRGRPRNTWVRCVRSECEGAHKSWNQIKTLAMDRNRWREFVDALCS